MRRIPCAFSVSKDFLDKIDARAEALNMSRSAYIVQVLRKDLLLDSHSLSIVAEESGKYGREQSGRKRKSRPSKGK